MERIGSWENNKKAALEAELKQIEHGEEKLKAEADEIAAKHRAIGSNLKERVRLHDENVIQPSDV
uniref:Remorin C-terminal domain-containing protein n=1 Tax=Cucumis sativus TaxID=3659 RepID=A0A0A0L0S7_CUCSA